MKSASSGGMRNFSVDQLTVRHFSTRAALVSSAAELVGGWIRAACGERGEARVIFACAPSQTEFLAALIEQPIDWARVVVFHMDEYVGLDEQHAQSFRRYLRENLLRLIPTPASVHLIEGDKAAEDACARYAGLLAAKPIDIVCMGIGENGHIAFNDPPVADFHDPLLVKRVELDRDCRQQQVNDGCFPSIDAVPTHALTLTVPALFGAHRISCVTPGERKARAVRETLLGPIGHACPATILRRHPHAILHIDDASAALLSE